MIVKALVLGAKRIKTKRQNFSNNFRAEYQSYKIYHAKVVPLI